MLTVLSKGEPMLDRFKRATDEIVLAEALIYFVFIASLAVVATLVARAL